MNKQQNIRVPGAQDPRALGTAPGCTIGKADKYLSSNKAKILSALVAEASSVL